MLVGKNGKRTQITHFWTDFYDLGINCLKLNFLWVLVHRVKFFGEKKSMSLEPWGFQGFGARFAQTREEGVRKFRGYNFRTSIGGTFYLCQIYLDQSQSWDTIWQEKGFRASMYLDALHCFNDFVFEHRSGCCATEPGYAEDIGAIEIWLIDWYEAPPMTIKWLSMYLFMEIWKAFEQKYLWQKIGEVKRNFFSKISLFHGINYSDTVWTKW